jgi:hypothetical protein
MRIFQHTFDILSPGRPFPYGSLLVCLNQAGFCISSPATYEGIAPDVELKKNLKEAGELALRLL